MKITAKCFYCLRITVHSVFGNLRVCSQCNEQAPMEKRDESKGSEASPHPSDANDS